METDVKMITWESFVKLCVQTLPPIALLGASCSIAATFHQIPSKEAMVRAMIHVDMENGRTIAEDL